MQKQEVADEQTAHAEELFSELPSEELDVPDHIEVATEHMFLSEHEVGLENPDADGEQPDHYQNVFVQEEHLQHAELEEGEVIPLQLHEENTSNSSHVTNGNDSDTGDYDIVEGVHVTADSEVQSLEDVVFETTGRCARQHAKPQMASTNSKLMRNVVRNNFVKGLYENNGVGKSGFYVIRQNEKENVANVQVMGRYQKPNPRSILKSSFPLLEENKEASSAVQEVQRNLDKRVLKNKVTTQARMLQNFIAKTTIIHAPVRQERLPRKQTIKPVKRQDEEIIVQEVVVSSNGFIETTEDGVLKSKEPLQPTEFFNLSDSDDDYDPRKRSKRKRKHKRQRTKVVIITDSEEEGSVIELSDSSDSEDGCVKLKSDDDCVVKKRRGRPLKTVKTATNEEEKENDAIAVAPGKKEIKCPKCSKTFPSEGSLKTHMQFHNFRESSLRNAKAATVNKFKCKECDKVFKNSALLNKHLSDHRSLGCNICKKIFATALELSAHKRLHVKERMCKSTVTEKLSPKQPQASRKSALNPSRTTLKCGVCSRTFRETDKFEAHVKTHKKFTCVNCGSSFVSKVMLDLHVRESCVKIKSPAKGRLSFKVRKSFMQSPKRLQVNNMSEVAGSAVRKSVFSNVECEHCVESFSSYTDLFKHKVEKHGLDTPDKSVLKNTKKALYRARPEHAGIPPSSRLRVAYAGLRQKLAERGECK